jgi:hypothetical protein
VNSTVGPWLHDLLRDVEGFGGKIQRGKSFRKATCRSKRSEVGGYWINNFPATTSLSAML